MAILESRCSKNRGGRWPAREYGKDLSFPEHPRVVDVAWESFLSHTLKWPRASAALEGANKRPVSRYSYPLLVSSKTIPHRPSPSMYSTSPDASCKRLSKVWHCGTVATRVHCPVPHPRLLARLAYPHHPVRLCRSRLLFSMLSSPEPDIFLASSYRAASPRALP